MINELGKATPNLGYRLDVVGLSGRLG